jgi:ketosteroid isomerase-like protein
MRLPLMDRDLTEEEEKLVADLRGEKNFFVLDDWNPQYRDKELDWAGRYTRDGISIPQGQKYLKAYDELQAWFVKRQLGYTFNSQSQIDLCEIVGDVAVLYTRFRVTRLPEDGVAGTDRHGVWLAVLRREDGVWKIWRDMDTPSPEADVFFHKLLPTPDVL